MRIPSVATFSIFLLAAGTRAQVPPGHAISGAIGSATPLLIVDRTPSATPVTGFTALTEVNAIKLDPLDSSIWVGASNSRAIVRVTLNGAAVSTQTTLGLHPGTAGTAAIAFDRDYNLLVCGGSVSTSGGIWKMERTTGTVTQIVGPTAGLTGTVNAMDSDPVTGAVYFGLYESGRIYKMLAPSYVPTLFTTVSIELTGITLGRRPNGNLLFASTFGRLQNTSLWAVDSFGAASTIPGNPRWADLNWVTYDEQRDDLWLLSNATTKTIWKSTISGSNTPLHVLPNGFPTSLDVNDSADSALLVSPTFVPTPVAPITIEHGLSGKPGHLGLIAMIQPFFLLLAYGPIDAGGRLNSKIPDIGIPPGTPGSFQFLAATIDPATLVPRLSNQVSWPAN